MVGIARIASMKVDAAARLQDAAHFKQPHGHKAHICTHAFLMCITGRVYGLYRPRVVIRKLVRKFLVNIPFPRPSILKLRPAVRLSGVG